MKWTASIALFSFVTNILCQQGYKYPAPSQPFNGAATQSPGAFPSARPESHPSPTPGYSSSPSGGFPSTAPNGYPTSSIGGYTGSESTGFSSSPNGYPGTSVPYPSPTVSGYSPTTPAREFTPVNGQYQRSSYPGATPERSGNGFASKLKTEAYPQGPTNGYPSSTVFPVSPEPTGYPVSVPGFSQEAGNGLSRPSPTPFPIGPEAQNNYPGSNNYPNGQTGSNGFSGSNGQDSPNFASGSGPQEDSDEGDLSAIPGQPDIDYPILASIPETSFRCEQQEFPGYYADVETRCQVFHICSNNKTFDFLCPNGTIFHQEYFVCVWWNQFDCNSAPSFFGLNANIYDYSIAGTGVGSSGESPNGAYPPTSVGPTTIGSSVESSNGRYQEPQGFKPEGNGLGYRPNYPRYPSGSNQGVSSGSTPETQNYKPVGPTSSQPVGTTADNQGFQPTGSRSYQPFDNQKYSTGTPSKNQGHQTGIPFAPTSLTSQSYPGNRAQVPNSSQRPFDNTAILGRFPDSSSTSRPGYLPPRLGQTPGANQYPISQQHQQNDANYPGQYPTSQLPNNGFPSSQGPAQIPTRDYLPPVRK
ncbi:hypothetical protein GWI33_018164 [Rhynchophorus ferrugineus]|uniref:Chitin-binding type-2 domain-containing protein n=1 Tax=Rhynchophorus ferrugineus TaxID=354439 RepID=A0A834HU43_RHYFE|nr:hypothetical protein GWI33_018164 [Rhynchophorus ferrugineus]KAF7268818.1 hypothetical protein GWI33_018164 [Rhynchophorus ferrugineus]